MDDVRLAGVLVGLHYATALAHGLPHLTIPIRLTEVQIAFVVTVIGLAPLVGVWLLARGRRRVGWGTLAGALLASLLFGLAFHYVLETPDHVSAVPAGPWKGPFVWSAALTAVVDGVGGLLALRFARRAG